LAAWLLISLLIAWFLRRRPIIAVSLAIFLWSLVPGVAGHLLTGVSVGYLAMPPATWLLLCIFVVQVLTNPRLVAAGLSRHPGVILIFVVFAAGAALTSVIMKSGGERLLMSQIVGPVLLWWLVVSAAKDDRRSLLIIRNAILLSAALQCVLALIQLRVGSIIFYQSDYARLPWFDPDRFDRWMGTADSPLGLSLLLSIAAGLAISVRAAGVRLGLLVLFLIGTIIVQGRGGTAVVCLIIIYSVLRANMALWARLLTTAALALVAYFLLTSDLISGLAGRLSNDTGSVDARILALRLMADIAGTYIFVGNGLTASYDVTRHAGLQSSLENSYLMYAVDVGFVLATLYFGLQFALLFRHGWRGLLPGATVAALAGVVLQHTFSAVASVNMSGTVIWTALAIVVAGSSDRTGRASWPSAQSSPEAPPLIEAVESSAAVRRTVSTSSAP
jgi:hypothetical protein